MRGRKPVPTHLKIIRGNPGKQAINKSEPKPSDREPVMPVVLQGEALVEWHRISDELRAMGCFRASDMAVIAFYASSWADWHNAVKNLNEMVHPLAYRGEAITVHPYYRVKQLAEERLLKAAAELGCTPSARSRLKVGDKDAQKQLDLEFIVGTRRQ